MPDSFSSGAGAPWVAIFCSQATHSARDFALKLKRFPAIQICARQDPFSRFQIEPSFQPRRFVISSTPFYGFEEGLLH